MTRDWADRHRANYPSLVLGLLLAALIVVFDVSADRLGLQTVLEVSLALAGGLSGFWPRAAGSASLSLLAVIALAPPALSGVGVLGALLPMFSLGLAGDLLWPLGYGVGACGLLVAGVARELPAGQSPWPYTAFWGIALVAAAVSGRAVGRLVRVTEAEADRRLLDQRRGIARDLHDTVAHGLSLIAMRAEESRLKGTATDDDLSFIVATADRSIHELRGMMQVLRQADEADLATPASRGSAPLDEVLLQCVQTLGDQGFRASQLIEGDASQLPDSVADALGKVALEATNNIVRHGDPGSACALLVEVTERDAAIAVTNVPGRRTGRHRHQPMGLIGMRERVVVLGGEFSAGMGATRWVTRATLPLVARPPQRGKPSSDTPDTP